VAVLVILGLLAAVVGRNVMQDIERGRRNTTMANLKILHEAVQQFKMDTGRYPTAEEGLSALVTQPTDVPTWQAGGYLTTTSVPRDGWNSDFVYELYPESGKPFVIKSLGADHQEGGDGDGADLLSTDVFMDGAGTGSPASPR
jgi:general secretion pathway protein G